MLIQRKEMPMARLLTIQEASALTRLRPKTLYSYTSQRTVPFVKLGGRVLFDEDRLLKWIEAHKVEPIAKARGKRAA
jgi:excisionase family DNA binding protein